MAQTGYTPILIYSSSTVSQAPAAGNLTNSTLGSELAINITDGKLFYKDNANAVQVIGWKTTPTTAGGTGLTSYTAGDLLYYASGTTLSQLAIGTSGKWLGSSGTAPQWNSPAALTKTDDTNVTLTLGGSASTALLNAASLTLGWTGQLAASRGGTGIGTYTAGDILYASGTTTLSKLGIGAANTVLTSSGTAPQWSTGLNNVTIGATTATTGKFTTIQASTNIGVGTATSVQGIFNVGGGRSFFGANSETYSIGLGYTQARVSSGQTFYIGATDATAPALVFSNSAGTERVRFFDGGGVSIGNTTDPGAKNLSLSGNLQTLTGEFNNVGTAQTISISDTNGGYVVITGVQGGVGSSTWRLNFVKRSGSLAIGTADKAILTADPISSVTVSSNNISVTPVAANTYITYAIYYTPLGA